MTGGAKRGKAPADKAKRKPMPAQAFIAAALAWARARAGAAQPPATGQPTR